MDFHFYGITLASLTVPYALAFLMPGRRTLALLGAVALFNVLLTIDSLWARPGDHGTEAGIYILLPAVAMLLGVLIRWLLLSRQISLAKPRGMVALVAGALVLPGTLASFAAYHKWEHRAPSEECMASDAAIKLAGEVVSIPVAPFVSLDLDKDEYGLEVSLIRHRDMRRFCERSVREAAPVEARSVTIDLRSHHHWGLGPVGKFRCKHHDGRHAWIGEACDAGSYRDYRATRLPITMGIYSVKDNENVQDPHYGKETIYEELQRLLRLGKEPNRFARDQWQSSDDVDVYRLGSERFFIFKKSGQDGSNGGEPRGFYCQLGTSGPDPVEHCRSRYRLRNGAGVEFWFEPDAAKALETFPRVDARMHEILASMTPAGKLPMSAP